MTAIGTTGLWAMAIACGVMAGVYLTFSAFVMASLDALPRAEGIAAMQSINRVILKSLFMPLFITTSFASLVLAVWGIFRWGHSGAPLLAIGGLIYFIGMFVCTVAFNVPLNNALEAVDPTAPEAAGVWSDYLRDWTRWNHVRALSSTAACALFIVGR
ncbi:MAG: DUF1772 domain-containing protein [Kofleriaceae bacterium]|nr:DUF1772 domain-containing protein [Kofleriaceae bacterium]